MVLIHTYPTNYPFTIPLFTIQCFRTLALAAPRLRFASIRAPEEARLAAGVGLALARAVGAFSFEKGMFFLGKMMILKENCGLSWKNDDSLEDLNRRSVISIECS